MADEQETIAPIEAEAPIETVADEPIAITDDEPDSEAELEAEGEEEADDPEGESEEDLEELDWNGRKVKVPKGLKDGVLMHADYTRKTQELAASRRELEQAQARLVEQSKASDEDLQMRAALMGRAEEIQKYEKVDWDAWEAQDPLAAQQGYRRYQTLKEEAGRIAAQIQQRAQQRTAEAQQDYAKRIRETHEYASTQIKGWTPELDQKIGDFARAQGVSDADLQAALNPTIYKFLHMAYLGHQLLNKPAQPKAPVKQAQPLQKVAAKGGVPARKSLSDMSMEEYVAYRNRKAS